MIKTTIFHISWLRTGKCHYTGIKYDTDVDPLIFLLNFHKFCCNNPKFNYLTFFDLLDFLYLDDKEKFYKQLNNKPECSPMPLGYDGRSVICGFQSTLGGIASNSVDLSMDTFEPIPCIIIGDIYNFEQHIYEPVNKKEINEYIYSHFCSKYLDKYYPKEIRVIGDISKSSIEFKNAYANKLKNLADGTHNLMGETFQIGVLLTDLNVIKKQFNLSEYDGS